MNYIRSGAPFVDVGVSIFHGSQTHRIQRQMLVDHLGMTAGQLSELMSDRDLQMYFSPSASEMQRLRSSSRANERIHSTNERIRGELPQVAQKSHNRFAVSSGGLKF